MASLQSPVSLSSRPSTSTEPAPPRKLRDSCHNCAISKLRCSKEKPTCARCVRQGKTCSYVPSKRAGRTQTMRLDGRGRECANSSTSPPQQVVASSENSVTMAPASMSPDAIHASTPQHPSSFQDMVPNFFSSAEQSAMSSPSASTHQFFDMAGVTLPWSLLDSIDNMGSSKDTMMAHSFIDSTLQQSIFPTPRSSLSISGGTMSDLSVVQNATLPSIHHVSAIGPGLLPTPVELPSDSSQCSCLSHALRLLQQSSLNSSESTSPVSMSDPTAQQRRSDQYKAARRDAAGNKKHVEAIINMAECSCSRDPYLLSLICLLVFKIMVLYKTAIQRSKQSVPRSERDHEREMGESSTTEKESCADDEETLRITAQSFFGELHLVQRLISSLSVRLRTFGQQDNGKQNMYNGGSVAADDITSLETREEEGGNLPLPVSLLHRLEVDLRRRLRALSGEIVDIIRDG